MKIAYFGYDLFYPCLEKLLNSKDIEVLKVFSFPENEDDKHEKVEFLARKFGVKFTEKKVSKEDLQRLCQSGCDLLVSAGYLYKIPVDNDILGINLHPAYLPIGRGGWPMPLTILKGLKKTGLTVHMLASKLDLGDILKRKEYVLKGDENLETLNMWYTNNCADFLYDCVKNFDILYEKRIPQGEGEYWKMPTKDDMTICDSMCFEQADRIARAFYGAGCYYKNAEQEIFMKKAYVKKAEKTYNLKENEFPITGGAVVCEKYGEI